MEIGLTGTVLTRDLVAADGRLVASRGEVVDLNTLKDVAARAPRGLREKPLFETTHAEAVLEAFNSTALQHLAGRESTRALAADVLAEVRFPQPIWDELESLRHQDGPRYQHAIFSGITAARLFRAALGSAPGLSRLVGGALLHDIGMLHVAVRLRFKRDYLTRSEALALEDHPILGAMLLASVLGDVPAVHFALLHHTRAGWGYPRVQSHPPLRGLDLISVAGAFAALVAPRSFRLTPFSARGAVDQLIDDAEAGHFDPRAVRLLVHCLRLAPGSIQELQLPRKHTGFRPPVNHHGLSPEMRVA
jgi:HD-GYP domain-containing protein (c-di-GMP phosphodiesterase class II)